MAAARLLLQGLGAGQSAQRPRDQLGHLARIGQRQGRRHGTAGPGLGQARVEGLQAFDAAQPAAGAAGQLAALLLQAVVRARGHVQVHLQAQGVAAHVDVAQLVDVVQQAFGQHEAHRQVVDLQRRGHHHHVRHAVDDDGHGAFVDHVVGLVLRAVGPVPGDVDPGAARWGRDHAAGLRRTATAFDVGVRAPTAWLSSGTSTLVSG